jgi:hypothetical protein
MGAPEPQRGEWDDPQRFTVRGVRIDEFRALPEAILRWAGIIALSALLGLILAAIAEYAFFRGGLSGLNLVLWTALAVGLGAASRTWPRALAPSAVAGFAIVFGYAVLGYGGRAPLVHAVPAFAALAIVGAAGLCAAATAGHAARRIGRRRRPLASPDQN